MHYTPFIIARTLTIGILCLACGGGDANILPGPGNPPPPDAPGDMELSSDEIHCTEAKVGTPKEASLTISSVGDGLLRVIATTITDDGGGVFSTNEEANLDIMLITGESGDLVVTCDILTTDEEIEGVLKLETNDINDPVLDIPLIATPWGFDDEE
jgi:hypothetical protein